MCHVANPSQKLLFIMREHHALTHPKIHTEMGGLIKLKNEKKTK